MDKVKLPREVAEAIEKVWCDHGAIHLKHMTLNNWNYLSDNYHISVKVLRPYAENHPIEYMQALVNGYEVEETPEDRIRNTYNRLKELTQYCNGIKDEHGAFLGQMSGMLFVLHEFNIKIEGVNDK